MSNQKKTQGLRRTHGEVFMHKALSSTLGTHMKTNQEEAREEGREAAQWGRRLLPKDEDLSPDPKNPHKHWGTSVTPCGDGNLGRGNAGRSQELASQPAQPK